MAESMDCTALALKRMYCNFSLGYTIDRDQERSDAKAYVRFGCASASLCTAMLALNTP
jgi:hypothetical protein